MKKILFICLFALIPLCINAQTIFEKNKNVSLGIQFGTSNQHDYVEIINASIYGIYLDVGGAPYLYKRDKENNEYSFHVGYQIPFFKCVKIAPVVGGYTNEKSITYINTYNTFTINEKINAFDYGCNVQLDINRFSVFGTFTKNVKCFGIGLNIPIKIN